MKIKTRFTILFTVLTAALLFSFAAIIYFTAKKNREFEFYSLLQQEALTKANLLFNAKVETSILQNIYRNNREILNEVEVSIYRSTDFKLLYHDAVEIDVVKETNELLQSVLNQKVIKFYQDKWQVIGLRHSYNGEDFIVFAAAYDQFGFNTLNKLFKNTLLICCFALLFLFFIGKYFIQKVFAPMQELLTQANKISVSNLHLRLNAVDNKDELNLLANTFNEMLDRLETSFEAQKQFVSNISHELRTPLSAIITELELADNKSLTQEEYKQTIQQALTSSKRLARLSSSLLDFAKASYDSSEIHFKALRMDEVLLDAVSDVQRANPNYNIEIEFDSNTVNLENDEALIINGNEYLLKIACINLLENACKFSSNRKVSVMIQSSEKELILYFKDTGIGIHRDDLKHIFTPFFRAENGKEIFGNGIGLSLTQKIIELHKASIQINSEHQKGTVVTLKFSYHV
jgi:two-component system sensor histidine kinase ArlS